jgi:hypothetical protein
MTATIRVVLVFALLACNQATDRRATPTGTYLLQICRESCVRASGGEVVEEGRLVLLMSPSALQASRAPRSSSSPSTASRRPAGSATRLVHPRASPGPIAVSAVPSGNVTRSAACFESNSGRLSIPITRSLANCGGIVLWVAADYMPPSMAARGLLTMSSLAGGSGRRIQHPACPQPKPCGRTFERPQTPWRSRRDSESGLLSNVRCSRRTHYELLAALACCWSVRS